MPGAFLIYISLCRICGCLGIPVPGLTWQYLQIRTLELEGTALLDELIPICQHQWVK